MNQLIASTISALDENQVKGKSTLLVGKDREIRVLRDALGRVRKEGANAEAVFIHGYSGTGKSLLATKTMGYENESILFASGKFDQNRGAVPFGAVSNLLAELCANIRGSKHMPEITRNISDKLSTDDLKTISLVSSEIGTLVSLPENTDRSTDTALGFTAVIRFMRLFRKFVATVATPEIPVVLFVDDLQWADDASRKLISSFFKDDRIYNVLFLGAIRDGETTTFEPPVDAVLRWQKISCRNFELDEVVYIIHAVTGWPEAESAAFGNSIFKKTAGNPFFVKELMSKLLRFNDETSQYDCDLNEVESDLPSTNFVDLFVQKIASLSNVTQVLLIIGSALGHTFHAGVLEPIMGTVELISLFPSKLLSSPDDRSHSSGSDQLMITVTHSVVVDSISESCQAGLLEETKVDGRYRFTHDRVQQSALSMLPGGSRGERIKATLGAVIMELGRSNKSEPWFIYTAATLLVRYQSKSQMSGAEIAEVCLEASKAAASQAAFRSGAKYADAGIKVLGQKRWKDRYDLCLQLYDQSMRLHFSNGNLDVSSKRTKVIRKEARCIEDQICSYFVTLGALTAKEDNKACVSEGLKQIQSLGVKISTKSCMPRLLYVLFQTKRMLRGKKLDEILNLPTMEDTKIITATKLLGIVAAAAFDIGKDNLLMLCCLRMFQLTLKHGLSDGAVQACACYGVCLAFLGDLDGAFEAGRVTVELGRKFEAGCAPASVALYTACYHLKRPLKECMEASVEASVLGIKYGDAFYASFATRSHGAMGFFVGRPSLAAFEKDMKGYCDAIEEYKQLNHLAFLTPWAQLIENLRGKSVDALTLKGSYMDENKVVREYEQAQTVNNRNVVLMVHHARLVLLYLCQEYKKADEDRRAHAEFPPATSTTYIFILTQAVFSALTCYALAIETGQKRFLRQASKYEKTVKSFGKVGSPNIPPMVALMEAEVHTFHGHHTKAAAKYDEAIAGLKDLEFYLLEAIATERKAISLLDKNPENSRRVFSESYQKYKAFGATVKVSLMEKTHGDCLTVLGKGVK